MWLPPISILVGLLTFRVDHIGYTGSLGLWARYGSPGIHMSVNRVKFRSYRLQPHNVGGYQKHGALLLHDLSIPLVVGAL